MEKTKSIFFGAQNGSTHLTLKLTYMKSFNCLSNASMTPETDEKKKKQTQKQKNQKKKKSKSRISRSKRRR